MKNMKNSEGAVRPVNGKYQWVPKDRWSQGTSRNERENQEMVIREGLQGTEITKGLR